MTTKDRAVGRAVALLRRVGIRRNDDSPEHVLKAARAVMRSKRYCVFVTEGVNEPDARVVQPFRPDENLVVHIGTSPGSRKAKQVVASGRAVLVYERDRDAACVVARCAARVLDDEPSRQRYFMPTWRAFWPAGPDDDFVVIRCEPQALEVWDARRGVTPPPFGLRAAHLVRTANGWERDAS